MRGAYYKISTMSEEARAKRTGGCISRKPCTGCCIRQKTEIRMQGYNRYADSNTIDQSKSYKSYGAEVILYGDVYDDSCAYAEKLAQERGSTFVHPFDDLDIVAGQGSIAMEIVQELPNRRLYSCASWRLTD